MPGRKPPPRLRNVIGIDLGMALVAIEDARTGFVWRLMARSPVVQRGLRAAGFHHVCEKLSGLPRLLGMAAQI